MYGVAIWPRNTVSCQRINGMNTLLDKFSHISLQSVPQTASLQGYRSHCNCPLSGLSHVYGRKPGAQISFSPLAPVSIGLGILQSTSGETMTIQDSPAAGGIERLSLRHSNAVLGQVSLLCATHNLTRRKSDPIWVMKRNCSPVLTLEQ